MPRLFTRTLLLWTLACLSACAPWPHVEHTRPTVVGKLLDGGKPVPGADIFLGMNPGAAQPCDQAGEVIEVSSDNGGFQISRRSKTEPIWSFLNPPSVTSKLTAVCIRRPHQAPLLGALLDIRTDKPLSLSMECELSKRPGRDEIGATQVSGASTQLPVCSTRRVAGAGR